MLTQYGWPERQYATVAAPTNIRYAATDTLPAPAVIRTSLRTPLRGLLIDHVPTGAAIAAIVLRRTRSRRKALQTPLLPRRSPRAETDPGRNQPVG